MLRDESESAGLMVGVVQEHSTHKHVKDTSHDVMA